MSSQDKKHEYPGLLSGKPLMVYILIGLVGFIAVLSISAHLRGGALIAFMILGVVAIGLSKILSPRQEPVKNESWCNNPDHPEHH